MLSSGWIWRYRDLSTFRWGAPGGDPDLQGATWHEFPDAVAWLESTGAHLLARATTNARTDGIHVDPRQAIDTLLARLPSGTLRSNCRVGAVTRLADDRLSIDCRSSDDVATLEVDAVVVAGGGYAGDLARVAEQAELAPATPTAWLRRSAGTSDGTTQRAVLALGADWHGDSGACYARAMPAGIDVAPADFVRASQVYAAHATMLDSIGAVVAREPHDWSDSRVTWQLARRGGAGWLLVDAAGLAAPTPYGTIADAVAIARELGATVLDGAPAGDGLLDQLSERVGSELPDDGAASRARAAQIAVQVCAGITHSHGGIRIDATATPMPTLGVDGDAVRWLRQHVRVVGVDAGGIATGGYGSGLAQALTLGRIAARTLLTPAGGAVRPQASATALRTSPSPPQTGSPARDLR